MDDPTRNERGEQVRDDSALRDSLSLTLDLFRELARRGYHYDLDEQAKQLQTWVSAIDTTSMTVKEKDDDEG